jgi:tRNA A-37 threonylcarbamoyl transferase component Bud32
VLSELHSYGSVHGDLKPANIVSSQDKTSVTFIDFGAASFQEGVESSFLTNHA